MNTLDVHTVVFSILVTDTVCTAVLVSLWIQNRRRFRGTFFWAIDFGLQTLDVLLLALRGRLPDWLSIGFANILVIAGAYLGYLGLERFAGKRSAQLFNYLVLAVFALANTFFAFFRPSLEARNFCLSLALFVICFQCTWLMMYRVKQNERRRTLAVGLVFGVFCLVTLVRLVVTLAGPQQSNDFFRSDEFETLTLMAYQVLLILLTFNLSLMVNNHLAAEGKLQEEKFAKAFHSSPYAILLTQAEDGRIIEANDGFTEITGHPLDTVIGKTTLELKLWVDETDRARVVEELSQGKPVHEWELKFRKKSGEALIGLFSAETILVGDRLCMLSSISDITERKSVEQVLHDHQARLHQALDAAQGGIWEWDLQTNENFWSEELWKLYGLEPHSCEPSYEAWLQTIHPDDRAQAAQAVQDAANNGSELRAEWRVADQGKGERWLMSRGQPVREASGQVERYIGTVLDITERKKAEQRAETLAKFPSENPNPTLRLDRNGTILYANPSSQPLLAKWNTEIGQACPKEWSEVASAVLTSNASKTADEECNGRIYSFFVAPVHESQYVNLYARDVTEQRQAEAKLVESEQRYRSLFENMLNGFAYCQMFFKDGRPDDFKYLAVNAAFEKLTGLQGVVGKNVSEVVPGIRQSDPGLFDAYGRVALTGQPETFETYVEALKMWFSISVYSPQPEYFVAVFDVITERKQAEEDLRLSEDKFKYIFDYSTVGKSITLPSGEIHPNKAFCEMLGYSPEELDSKKWREISHPEDIDLNQKVIDSILAGEKESGRFIKRFIHKNGNVVWGDIGTSLRRDDEGNPLYFISTIMDITERKQVEAALQESETNFRALAENAGEGILIAVAGGAHLFANEAMAAISGYSVDELLRLKAQDLADPDETAKVMNRLKLRLAGEAIPQHYETGIVAKDGRKVPVQINSGKTVWKGQPADIVFVQDITERKLEESARRQSELLFRTLFELSPDAIVLIDPYDPEVHSRIVDCNEAACRMNGYAREEMVGRPIDLVNAAPYDEAGQLAYLDRLYKERVLHLEVAHRRKDGAIFPVDVSTTMIQVGERELIIGIDRDVTERKQAEEKLRESQARFSKIFHASPVGINIFRLSDNRSVEVNDSFLELTGYSRQEVVDHTAGELNLFVDAEARQVWIQALKQNQSVKAQDARIRRKNGEIRNALAAIDVIELDGERMGLVITTDITQRKQAEQALLESEARYRDLVQNANSAILRWKRDGTISFFNEYAQSFFGYKADDVIGKGVNILLPQIESTGGDLTTLVADILAHPDRFVNNVNENLCRDGRRVWMAWTNKPILDSNGQVAEVLAVGVDITERKKAEQELKLALEELKRSNAELEQFAYVASHDLQEPLRMVSSYMQLLERRYKGKLDKDADDFIGFAVDGSARMQRLINDLLAYSRVGTRGLPFAPTSSEAALGLALENLHVAVQENKAKVTHDPLPEVVADETQLVQLFQNLIGNALKFHGRKAPRVHVSVESKEREWVFSVRDNGIGIDSQYTERIFIIFQRLHGRDKYAGTGIGLAICKKIVQRHGGRIWVESQPDQGATFYFTLPKKGDGQP
ncbi:MAG TPA: PAS domain S-box protein [Anaerolineales bacterium]|nr:PAS domain S-box protein [Anaerolineales bacterium]